MASKANSINLFRNILREHRKLPTAMRQMGDSYVRHEFQQHKNAKPEHLEKFMNGWQMYYNTLRQKSGTFGEAMSEDVKNKLSKEQQIKMSEMKNEASRLKE